MMVLGQNGVTIQKLWWKNNQMKKLCTELFIAFQRLVPQHILSRGGSILAETKTEEVKISHEHRGYTWMDYNSSMEKTTFDNAKTVLTKAEKLLSNTL